MILGAALVVSGAWELFRWQPVPRPLIGMMLFGSGALAAIAALRGAARRCAEHPRLRSVWRTVAVACCVYLAGYLAQTVYELADQGAFPLLASSLYLLFYPIMLWGLLRLPVPQRTLAEKLRLGLDLAVVAVGAAALVACAAFGSAILKHGSGVPATFFAVAYPVGDVVLIVGLASIFVRGSSAANRRSLALFSAGLGVWVAADMIYGYLTFHSHYQVGDPVDWLYLLGGCLFGFAGAAQPVPEPSQCVADAPRRRIGPVPYLAVALCSGLLLLHVRHDRPFPDGSLVLSAVVMAVLLSTRQLITHKDLLATHRELAHQSAHDPLTGLPNRALVLDRAHQMLARARRTGGLVAALFIDIDHFKQINDSLGHAAGDELLRTIARRLSAAVRQADTIGRLGGDEFVVLLEGFTDAEAPRLVATRICEAIRAPVTLHGRKTHLVSTSGSVGIASGARGSVDALLGDADLALYEAKQRGRDGWVMHTPDLQPSGHFVGQTGFESH